ncbi:hypothetical protein QFC21_001566 [Naganishia friedmannii]|uniref:Uncharacterized protein n=1 Tax=Naganishia friedmannii TaxID=89922 RepID=A0ACC2W3V8_9TREE|nr:hypothetical protein QFC21_001566 [Naganishia friedmannii]
MACEIEMARSIYVNITHEKMALLKYMRGNEERKAQEQGALQVSLQENIEKALSRIQDSAKQQFGTLSTLIAQFEKNDANAHTQLRETALRMRDAGEGLWDEVRREMEVSAEGGRKVLDDQVREMRYMNQQQFEIAMTQDHIRFGQMMDDRVALFTVGPPAYIHDSVH